MNVELVLRAVLVVFIFVWPTAVARGRSWVLLNPVLYEGVREAVVNRGPLGGV